MLEECGQNRALIQRGLSLAYTTQKGVVSASGTLGALLKIISGVELYTLQLNIRLPPGYHFLMQ